MGAGRVTTIDEALTASENGFATTIVTPVLEQRVARIEPGERLQPSGELLFVAAGSGVLRVGVEEYPLEPETGAFVADGEDGEVESVDRLDLVAVRVPPGEPAEPRVARYAEQGAESAGIGREFRLLAACTAATQFIGVVPPGRAKMHNHPYDEVSFLVEGEGVLHWEDGTSVGVGPGSCIHFPRLVLHSLENTGSAPLRIMGVFHPAGSPADRIDVLDY
jgi:mannose-6-phosphate isomerase-like protein (cupin superfamily)